MPARSPVPAARRRRGLLRLEAYLAPPAWGSWPAAIAGAGAPRSRTGTSPEDPCSSGLLLVGAGIALWVVVSMKVGRRAWAYWVALALQAGLILVAAAVTYEAVWGAEGALASAAQSATAAPGWFTALLPLLLLFVVPVATLVLLLLPASRRAALPVAAGSVGRPRLRWRRPAPAS